MDVAGLAVDITHAFEIRGLSAPVSIVVKAEDYAALTAELKACCYPCKTYYRSHDIKIYNGMFVRGIKIDKEKK
jgi:hypothetical protein